MRMSRPETFAPRQQLISITLTQSLFDFGAELDRWGRPFSGDFVASLKPHMQKKPVDRTESWLQRCGGVGSGSNTFAGHASLPRTTYKLCYLGEPYGPAQPSRVISSITASWRFERWSTS
jgi:hypothetical protein